MFCKNCGRQLDEGETLCPACGTVNATEATADKAVSYEYSAVDTANQLLKDEMAGQTLKWGILSLAFAASGCLSLLGFIFSFIAKSKALAYEQTFGVPEGKARVGRILGKVGFGLGLGMTIYIGIAFFVGLLAGLAEAGLM
jgi:RNA polymerase subunit RPABC4/transcription elongation factor Spt4